MTSNLMSYVSRHYTLYGMINVAEGLTVVTQIQQTFSKHSAFTKLVCSHASRSVRLYQGVVLLYLNANRRMLTRTH